MKKVLAVMVAAVALAGGCSSGDVGDEPVEATRTPAPTATPCSDASAVEGQADLEMQDYSFTPPCLQISTAQGLRVHNEGGVAHNLSVENIAGIDIDVEPGDENNTEPTGLTQGRYTIFCKFHRDSQDMEGELRVVPS